MGHESGKKDEGAHLERLIGLDKSSLPPDGGERFNRLIFAGSPYLLQHAENPVAWYQWGEEAFAKATREDKPVFLSIGYATCHWCHVMAHESFEDPEVAAVLNRHFISIKVDREERPDIDDRYMTVSRLMTGSGGWPLNVVMTPDRKPFLTVTYLPRKSRQGMPGIIQLLENIATLWRTQRNRVERNCADVMQALGNMMLPAPASQSKSDLLEPAFRQLAALYDPEWGGFGTAPKFPMPVNLSFLFRYWEKTGDDRPREMAMQTLRMMRGGGIWDQIGGGFHRYSVDRQWLVPHFEKMLYDQALIASTYIDAFRVTGNPSFRETAEEIFSFVLAELTAPEGGFYSALDADSEGEEGKYYVWTRSEILSLLGNPDGELFCRLFGVSSQGNFEGSNIIHLPLPPEEFARGEAIAPESLSASVGRWRELLRSEREKRIRPLRDEKIVTAWNGMMITALAQGYSVTGDPHWQAAAENAAAFIGEHLYRNGRLMRSCHAGQASVPAFLEDYAFFVQGLLSLYEATLRKEHLDNAIRLSREMLRTFRDDRTGGLFDTGADAEEVLVRWLDASDNVMPSANAVAAGVIARLGRIIGDDSSVKAGEAVVNAFIGPAGRQPAGYLQLISVRELLDNPPFDVTLAGKRDAPETGAMLRVIGSRFIPNLVLRFEETADLPAEARICARSACLPPVHSAGELEKLLDELV